MRITACRHQDIQELSGDDKMAPYRVRARAPPHASGPLGRTARSPKMAAGHRAGRSEAENRRKIDLPAEARNVPSRPLMNVTITG